MSKAYLNPDQASERLYEVTGHRLSVAYLKKLRCIGGGPAFRRWGRSIVYEAGPLDVWALARLSAPMSSTSQAEVRAA